MQPSYARGIDASHYNGDIAPMLKTLDYAISQATVGTWTDPAYASDLAKIHAAKLPAGAYHYAVYGPGPTRQARAFLAVAGNAEFLALDAETRGSNRLLQHPDTITALIADIRRLDPHKRKILLYSSDDTDVIVNGKSVSIWSAITAQDGNWVANYSVSPQHAWQFWQFSGTGVDHDVFHGSAAQLHAWIGAA